MNDTHERKKKKEKKTKITYIDDGRTIADMSGTSGGHFHSGGKKQKKMPPITNETPWQTYWRTARMMVAPMFVVLGILAVLYILFYFLL